MTEQRHLIWSNYDLDYEDWRDDLEEDHPELTEDERMALMYEINNRYLDDERVNLNIQLDQPILVMLLDLGRLRALQAIRKSPAAISGTAFTLITTTPHGMWTETETSGAMTPTMTAQTIISIGCIRTMFPSTERPAQRKNLQRHSHQSRYRTCHPRDLAMKSERCTLELSYPTERTR